MDSRDALELLLETLRVPGVSCQEGKILEFIRKQLTHAGLPANAIRNDGAHRRSPNGGEIGNLIVKLPGTLPGPRRLLMAHADTVPLCKGAEPLRRGIYLHSRNRSSALPADNRSGVAAILVALLRLLKEKLPHPPLTFMWTVQEEVGLCGARYADLKLLGDPQLCFNWDGYEPYALRTGATGALHLDIDLKGLASHAGSAPEKGVSAHAIAALAISELHQHGWHGLVAKGRKRGTSNIGSVRGGEATNVVSDRVQITAEIRSHDPKFRRKILEAFQQAFTRAAKTVCSAQGRRGQARVSATLKYEAFQLRQTDASWLEAQRVLKALKLKPQPKILNAGLDANWLTARGLPTITLGAGQRFAHTVKARLHIPHFIKGCEVALALATAGDVIRDE